MATTPLAALVAGSDSVPITLTATAFLLLLFSLVAAAAGHYLLKSVRLGGCFVVDLLGTGNVCDYGGRRGHGLPQVGSSQRIITCGPLAGVPLNSSNKTKCRLSQFTN